MEFDDERPSDCALVWARYWIDEFSAADFDDAAPWIPHFPAPCCGAEYARDFCNAGWGTPGRPPEVAGLFQRANVAPDAALRWHDAGFTAEQTDKFLDPRVSPAEAQRWLDAGMTPDQACKFIAARISVDEAAEADYDDATLDTLAALLRGSPVTRPTD